MRELFRRAPELERVDSILELREHTVQRLASQMLIHEPKLNIVDARRCSFIAVNAVLGVIQTMIYDDQQKYERAELSRELKNLVKSYFDLSR